MTTAGSQAGYDVIADVHGHADKLEGLLNCLGYRFRGGAWGHPDRQAVFIGDLIDRGPAQRRTVDIARAMIDSGNAQMVLGNHEFNAIAWATPDPEAPGEYLRSHSGVAGARHKSQHQAFLNEVGEGSPLHYEYIDWFLTQPMWLDLGGIRLVHACWDTESMEAIIELAGPGNTLSRELVVEASRKGSKAYEAIETLLKGPEIELPPGFAYRDKDDHPRGRARLRWWDASATTLRGGAEIPSGAQSLDCSHFPELPDTPLPAGTIKPYVGDVPVLFGHYWRTGKYLAETAKTACIDYSAGAGDPLVAYRWNEGEVDLTSSGFVAYPSRDV